MKGPLELKEYIIDTVDWAYFDVPRLSRSATYSRAFDFVRVNLTYYQIPSMKRAES
jgi:uncharacterized protein YecE (DUF72 family)